jgi:hypothetical protein
MSVPTVDIATQAQSRIAGLLRASARFRARIAALVESFVDARDALLSLDTLLDVDTQEGVNLDVIGRIVGQPRRLLGAVPRSFFSFAIEGGGSFQRALGMGDRARSQQGGAMWNRGASLASSALIDTAAYRLAIKARIVKNNLRLDGTKPWVEYILDVLDLILTDHWYNPYLLQWTYPVRIHAGGMHIEIGLGKQPSARSVALIMGAGLLPVPQGVGLGGTYWDDSLGAFGFAGKPSALAMGDRAQPGRGGPFAERITRNASS